MAQLTDEQLLELAAGPESEWVERTVSVTNGDKFGEAICAFANDLSASAQPGHLFIGVDDAGAVKGVTALGPLEMTIAAFRDNGSILPPPSLSLRRLPTPNGVVVAVEVMPSDRPPVRYRGRTFVRVGARRAIASIEEERRLGERAVDQARTWDLWIRGDATLDDLALDLFTLRYLPKAIAPDVLAENGRSIPEQMAALRLYDFRAGKPTNGAVVLFGKDPLGFLPGAYVQYVRYDGLDKAADVIEERRIMGDLGAIMTDLDRMTKQIAVARPVRQPDLRDRTIYDYPPVATHELFMNAVIHRNYQPSNAPVYINQFIDRIEIINPGSLHGSLTAANFPGGEPAYRCPVIAEAARVLGFVNRFGRGIDIANAQLRRNDSRPAEFEPSNGYFLARIWKRV